MKTTYQGLKPEDILDIFNYDEDTGTLTRKKGIGRFSENLSGTISDQGYIKFCVRGKLCRAHRLIYLLHYKVLPEFIDHIDGNRLNNHISNLRPSTPQENLRNTKLRSDNTTHIKGVSKKANGKYRARINIDGKEKGLGTYDNKYRAMIAYNRAAIKIFGAYAKLNLLRKGEVCV